MAADHELNTWGEIAAYLGQSVRNVQRWERQLGLPVHRMPGKKARVFAYTGQLDGWKTENSVARRPEISFGSHAEAEDCQMKALPILSANPSTISGRLYFRKLLTVAALLIGAIALLVWRMYPRQLAADFRVSGKDLVAVDARGRELWRYAFAFPLWESFYTQEVRSRFGWIGELEHWRGPDLLFVAKLLKAKELGDTLYCFTYDGRLRWQFVPGRAVTDGSQSQLLPPYVTAGLEVLVGSSPERTRIAISSNHYLEQPDQVAFLDVNGHVTGEYWHPGHLLHLAQSDLDGDGKKELLLGGVNNGDHQATLVVLDPLNTVGVVTPKNMADHRFELLNMSSASEKTVVLFPRSCISKGQPYTRVRSVQVTKDRVIVEVAEGTISQDPGFVYEFDRTFTPIQVTPGDIRVAHRHQELESENQLDHKFQPEIESERLKAAVVVLRLRN